MCVNLLQLNSRLDAFSIPPPLSRICIGWAAVPTAPYPLFYLPLNTCALLVSPVPRSIPRPSNAHFGFPVDLVRALAAGVDDADVPGGEAVLILPRPVPPPKSPIRGHAPRPLRDVRPEVGGGDRALDRRCARGKRVLGGGEAGSAHVLCGVVDYVHGCVHARGEDRRN